MNHNLRMTSNTKASRARPLGTTKESERLHPLLSLIPVALSTATVTDYIAWAASRDLFWFRMGIVCNALAFVGVVAMLAFPDLMDWVGSKPARRGTHSIGYRHMQLGLASMVVTGINATIQYGHWISGESSASVAIALSLVGAGLTVTAAYLGWQLSPAHPVTAPRQTLRDRMKAETRRRALRPSFHTL